MEKKLLLLLMSLSAISLSQSNKFQYEGTVDYLNNNPQLKVADGNSTIATSYTAEACGLNYTQASVLLAQRNTTIWPGVVQPAPLVVSSLPPSACATILKAFLYVSVNGSGIPITATLTNPQNVTSSFSMAIIGQGPNTCWNYPGTYSYRADVTSAITGNGTYSISGIPVAPTSTAQPDDAHGATLFIIYKDVTQNYTGGILIGDGCGAKLGGTQTSSLGGFNVCGNPNYSSNFLLVADLQGIANSPIGLNSASSNYTFLQANQTGYNFVAAPGAPATNGQNLAYYSVTSGSDCYSLVMAGLYYRASCLTCTFVPNTPSVSVSTSSNPICSGNQATLTASGSSSYTWSTNSNNTSVIVSPTVNTTYMVWSANGNGCASASLTQSVSVCNGIRQNEIKQHVKIYPNPSEGKFNFDLEESDGISQISIYNSIGQLIYQNELRQGSNVIDLTKYSRGYYHAVMHCSNKESLDYKIIIE